ncbi:MAG TPA: hypothetical protein VFJ90_07455 [Candidatus Didemnitutus sp.]|nr:hypothetical protein [Candidatus Didemnitutus sp.]
MNARNTLPTRAPGATLTARLTRFLQTFRFVPADLSNTFIDDRSAQRHDAPAGRHAPRGVDPHYYRRRTTPRFRVSCLE